jgi:hypothetical protein
MIAVFSSTDARATRLTNFRATLHRLTLGMTQTSALLSSIPYLQLFVIQYVVGGELLLFVKVLQNWTI